MNKIFLSTKGVKIYLQHMYFFFPENYSCNTGTCSIDPCVLYTSKYGMLKIYPEVSERVNFVLNSEIAGQYISTLLANLTLSSNGSLDHLDMLEGRDDDKGQDNEIPNFGGAAFPSSSKSHNHHAVGQAFLNPENICKCLEILFL